MERHDGDSERGRGRTLWPKREIHRNSVTAQNIPQNIPLLRQFQRTCREEIACFARQQLHRTSQPTGERKIPDTKPRHRRKIENHTEYTRARRPVLVSEGQARDSRRRGAGCDVCASLILRHL